MIIVLLLFFQSICLYCQRLVLHIHDRWINPKNVRIIREAAEAKGVKIIPEEYRQPSKKSKKRRYTQGYSSYAYSPSSGPSAVLSTLGKVESCHFCANTPQGYCRHHFHLQELQVHKQQQKIWCPLGGGFSNRSVEYKQLRKIKRELKQTLKQHTKPNYTQYSNNAQYQSVPTQAPAYETNQSVSTSSNDSGYQTNSIENSQLEEADEIILYDVSLNAQEYVDLPTPNSMVETTYSFKSCSDLDTQQAALGGHSAHFPRDTTIQSFRSCESSTISTTYL